MWDSPLRLTHPTLPIPPSRDLEPPSPIPSPSQLTLRPQGTGTPGSAKATPFRLLFSSSYPLGLFNSHRWPGFKLGVPSVRKTSSIPTPGRVRASSYPMVCINLCPYTDPRSTISVFCFPLPPDSLLPICEFIHYGDDNLKVL